MTGVAGALLREPYRRGDALGDEMRRMTAGLVCPSAGEVPRSNFATFLGPTSLGTVTEDRWRMHRSYRLRSPVLSAIGAAATALVLYRGVIAIAALREGDPDPFLAFPMAVILPAIALLFLASLKRMISEEGVLMQLGAMVQLLLILALPAIALHLALGLPVVFLLVELFETKAPRRLRAAIKARVIA